jgi:hypothetical protein
VSSERRRVSTTSNDLHECARRGVAVANSGRVYCADVADRAVCMLIDVRRSGSCVEGSGLCWGGYCLGSKVRFFFVSDPSYDFLFSERQFFLGLMMFSAQWQACWHHRLGEHWFAQMFTILLLNQTCSSSPAR